MAARKLQQEIDKTFKKIAEGRQAFDQLYDKIQQTTNAAQKEKLEDNLKREIKKLQRNRDQIKTWCAGNEIKDKKPLMEQRKLIENEMERFKAVEKEMKTKAFSKEGLSAAAKLDPKEQEKADAAQFLSEMVEELDRQIESLEAEQESLEANVKKGKKDTSRADRLAEIARLTEQHRWHQGKLELLLRALQNGNVDVEQLNDVKEGIKYYVEENQTPEFMEDDTLYDEFDLDADEGGWGMANELDKVTSQDAISISDDIPESSGTAAPLSKQKSSSADGPSTSGRRPSTTLKSPLPALATLHAPSSASTTSVATSNMKPAPPPTRAPGEILKYASAAAAAAASEKGGIAPLPPPPGAASNLAPLPSVPSKGSAAASPNAAPAVPVQISQKTSSTDSVTAGSIGKARSADSVATSSLPPTPALEKSEITASAKGKAAQPLATAQEEEESPVSEQPKTPPTVPRGATAQTNGEPAVKRDAVSLFHLPAGLQDLLSSFEITKDRVKADPSPAAQRLLEVSQTSCPDPLEGDKPFHYRPQNKYMTPAFYPQEPSQIAEDPALYSRIDTDTLFFIFYYRQGTYQQYLAAKSLKSQSWRFHKQYQTWFQRHEEPKTITEEFEQGTYRFFDYESTWMNRRKADFKFAYKFLEDDL